MSVKMAGLMTLKNDTYQWYRVSYSTRKIYGVTSQSYRLTSANRGKMIKVRVSFDDDRGNRERLYSEVTDRVRPRPSD